MYDIVVKRSRSLSHSLMSCCWLRPMSHATAILSRDFVAQPYGATMLQYATVHDRALQLCGIDKNWPISVHGFFSTNLHRIEHCFIRKRSCAILFKSCATCYVTLAILSRDKVAQQSCVTKLQAWHRSWYFMLRVFRLELLQGIWLSERLTSGPGYKWVRASPTLRSGSISVTDVPSDPSF